MLHVYSLNGAYLYGQRFCDIQFFKISQVEQRIYIGKKFHTLHIHFPTQQGSIFHFIFRQPCPSCKKYAQRLGMALGRRKFPDVAHAPSFYADGFEIEKISALWESVCEIHVCLFSNSHIWV